MAKIASHDIKRIETLTLQPPSHNQPTPDRPLCNRDTHRRRLPFDPSAPGRGKRPSTQMVAAPIPSSPPVLTAPLSGPYRRSLPATVRNPQAHAPWPVCWSHQPSPPMEMTTDIHLRRASLPPASSCGVKLSRFGLYMCFYLVCLLMLTKSNWNHT
jgi:hypothetical protein